MQLENQTDMYNEGSLRKAIVAAHAATNAELQAEHKKATDNKRYCMLLYFDGIRQLFLRLALLRPVSFSYTTRGPRR